MKPTIGLGACATDGQWDSFRVDEFVGVVVFLR